MYSSSTPSVPPPSSTPHPSQQGPQGFSPLFNKFEMDRQSSARTVNPRRRPGRGPPPPKTTLAAVLMLVTGTILLCTGLGIRWHTDPKEKERGLAMIILGSLLFIPGSYASFQLFGAWAGWPGYSYAYIPSYDD
ncbi:uncharacterized protein Naga_100197g8 [Nannochloropsis gaditana]|uniref:Transmembrane protein 230 n=3 Tax=Monodopsidaceae TaxID=425072 RepID=W7U4P6_9STRA|nr:uncharacterized protein Naga_100197g8 [Nannochloropsis gaditana]